MRKAEEEYIIYKDFYEGVKNGLLQRNKSYDSLDYVKARLFDAEKFLNNISVDGNGNIAAEVNNNTIP